MATPQHPDRTPSLLDRLRRLLGLRTEPLTREELATKRRNADEQQRRERQYDDIRAQRKSEPRPFGF